MAGGAARILAIEGPSAAGKTTLARRVARSRGYEYLSEAFARLDPPPSLELAGPVRLLALERRLLSEERRRFGEARAARRRGRTVVADTGFLGPLTYTAGLVALGLAPPELLARLLADARAPGALGLPDLTVVLEVPEPTRRRRAAADPVGHPASLAARHRAVARFERSLWRDRLAPLLPGQVVFVLGTGPPATVARRALAAVRRRTARSSPRTALGAVLSEIRAAGATRAPAGRRSSAATVKKTARSGRAPPR